MGRILLLSSGERSAANALDPVRARLQEAGHQVEWATLGRSPGAELEDAARARILRDRRAYHAWVRGRLLDDLELLAATARERLTLARPDAVVVPTDFYPGVLAAEASGAPWIGVTCSLSIAERSDLDYELPRAIGALAAERRRAFGAAGARLEFSAQHALSRQGTLLLAAPELVAGARLPPGVLPLGPARPLAPRDDEPWFPRWRVKSDRPVLVVSFGGRYGWQPELLTVVARAAAPCGGQLVLGAGRLADSTFPLTLPGDVLAARDLPQIDLLARADLLVTHGGAVTVMEATAAGVPMLVLPLGEDHPAQARAVERAGVGLSVEPGTLAEAHVRTAILSLLDERSGARGRARALAEAARARDGAERAAQAIGALT